jgi:hypothetical protein
VLGWLREESGQAHALVANRKRELIQGEVKWVHTVPWHQFKSTGKGIRCPWNQYHQPRPPGIFNDICRFKFISMANN